jgi:hypothetical protein
MAENAESLEQLNLTPSTYDEPPKVDPPTINPPPDTQLIATDRTPSAK